MQEVGAQLLLTDLPPDARRTIADFDGCANDVLNSFIQLGSPSLCGEMLGAPALRRTAAATSAAMSSPARPPAVYSLGRAAFRARSGGTGSRLAAAPPAPPP